MIDRPKINRSNLQDGVDNTGIQVHADTSKMNIDLFSQ